MWDTVAKDLRNIGQTFLKKADGAIIVIDVTSMESYNGIDKWFKLIEEHSKIGIAKIIVGTKVDLQE